MGGKAQPVIKRRHDAQEGPDLGAFGTAGCNEQLRKGGAGVGEHALLGGACHDAGAFIVAEGDADLVLLDHGEVGFGGSLGTAQDGQHTGEAGIARCLGTQAMQRAETTPARDQAIAVTVLVTIMGNGQGCHLDRHLLAPGAQGLHQDLKLGLVGDHAVAHEVIGVDGVKGQGLDHPTRVARGGHLCCEIRKGRNRRSLTGDAGNGWRAACGAKREQGRGLRRDGGSRGQFARWITGQGQTFTLGHGDAPSGPDAKQGRHVSHAKRK